MRSRLLRGYTVAIERAIDTKRELLLDFIRQVVAPQRWGLDHVDDYAAIWSRETGVPVDVSKQTLEARGFALVNIDEQVMADLPAPTTGLMLRLDWRDYRSNGCRFQLPCLTVSGWPGRIRLGWIGPR